MSHVQYAGNLRGWKRLGRKEEGAKLMRETPTVDMLYPAKLARLIVCIALAVAPLGARAENSMVLATQQSPATTAVIGKARPLETLVLQLAQTTSEQNGKTLQFGAPDAAPAAKRGETLQFGVPASPPPAQEGGTLQFGAPAAAPAGEQGQAPQLGAPPPAVKGEGLQIGGPAPAAAAEDEGVVRFSVPWVRAEGGWQTDSGSRAHYTGFLSGALRLDYRLQAFTAWSLQATVRADSYQQTGRFDDGTTRLDYGESFIRYDGDRTRITVGAQKVLWGRVDEIPPTDRMSVLDLTRYTLDDLADRRRAVPAARLEHSFDEVKLDAVLMPWFRPAELPDSESLWYPVRQEDGRIAGIRNPVPIYGQLIRFGTIGRTDDFDDFGGVGVRMSRRGAGFDAAVTVQRTRRSMPYYELDPAVRAAVLEGKSLDAALDSGTGPTFREVHPLTWLVGGDLALEALGGTVRLEAAWLSDVPLTTVDARLETHDALDWVGGYEFFPGDGNTRLTLQLAGHHVFGAPSNTLDRRTIYTFLGEVEIPFAQERWRLNTRFTMGLNDRDIYLNPRLSYVGWEPHEIFIAAHLFSGSERTFNGYYEDNDSIMLGWRAQF